MYGVSHRCLDAWVVWYLIARRNSIRAHASRGQHSEVPMAVIQHTFITFVTSTIGTGLLLPTFIVIITIAIILSFTTDDGIPRSHEGPEERQHE